MQDTVCPSPLQRLKKSSASNQSPLVWFTDPRKWGISGYSSSLSQSSNLWKAREGRTPPLKRKDADCVDGVVGWRGWRAWEVCGYSLPPHKKKRKTKENAESWQTEACVFQIPTWHPLPRKPVPANVRINTPCYTVFWLLEDGDCSLCFMSQDTERRGVFFIKMLNELQRYILAATLGPPRFCCLCCALLYRRWEKQPAVWHHNKERGLIDHKSCCAYACRKRFQHLSFLWDAREGFLFHFFLTCSFHAAFEEPKTAKHEHFAHSKYLYGQLHSVWLRSPDLMNGFQIPCSVFFPPNFNALIFFSGHLFVITEVWQHIV